MAQKIQHCAKSAMFYMQMSESLIVICAYFNVLLDTKKSVLEYKKLPNSVLDLYHTEVPPEHRGHGVAAQLVKVCSFKAAKSIIFFQYAFQYCKDNNYKVLPTCSYVAKYANEMATPEEKQLVVEKA